MQQLQGTDASFVSLETPNSPMHIGSILIYDPATAPGGFVRFKDILDFYRSRMQLSKTMRQKLVRVPFNIDYPYWIEDKDFDLEYHVRHVALPKPGDWRQLCIQAARIFSRPLDLSRPPWEFTIVEGLDNVPGIPKGCYAMVTKVHHAAIDGMSGIDLMQALHTLTADEPPPSAPDKWAPEREPNKAALFAKGYIHAWINPWRQAGVAARSIPGAYKTVRGLIRGDFDMDSAVKTPRTRFNVKISPHRVTEGRVFPLKNISAMRKLSEGAKVNDVMLTIVGGAMRKYLKAKDDLPKTTLTTMAPISVRSEGEKDTMGNQVAAMMAPLGTHIEDAAERLRYVHEQTSRSKAMTNAMGARQMSEASKVSPQLFMALGAQLYTRLGVANIMKPMMNTVVTNVPGPPVPIYSAGAQLLHMQGLLCLFDGVALGHVVQSYCAQATISFTACRQALPDPEFYSECLQDSYEDLARAAGLDLSPPQAKPAEKPAPKPRKPRKATAG
ncbi:MAG: wax ester/triacylglycerol synthase family O-acyltransferase [Hyphomonas sp.]|nr:wax ester/triacylglycerol synthase family O-acyltransferase [Hyphomonas sp.]